MNHEDGVPNFKLAINALRRSISDVEDRIDLLKAHPSSELAKQQLEKDLRTAVRVLTIVGESGISEAQLSFLVGEKTTGAMNEILELFAVDAGPEAEKKGIALYRKLYADLLALE